MKKSFLLIVCAFAFVLGYSSCGGSEEKSEAKDGNNKEQTEQKDQKAENDQNAEDEEVSADDPCVLMKADEIAPALAEYEELVGKKIKLELDAEGYKRCDFLKSKLDFNLVELTQEQKDRFEQLKADSDKGDRMSAMEEPESIEAMEEPMPAKVEE